MKRYTLILLVLLMGSPGGIFLRAQESPPDTGSVIFIHPDGSGLAAWEALRMLEKGPDGTINWDRMDKMGCYTGHLNNSLGSTSHGGATAHAFGVKVPFDSYGMSGQQPLTALSGKDHSIMIEARRAGMAVGIINSGSITEPGSGVFVASAKQRRSREEIARKVVLSGAEIIMSGGEIYLLPEGVRGRHGEEGRREDGENLIELARSRGYAVVYNRVELQALPDTVTKVLGVFAAKHTFNDETEEELRDEELPLYQPEAPTVAEMTAAALQILARQGRRFMLVVEEEGSDNFGNKNNARGTLTALSRADQAIGVALSFIEAHPHTLLVTAADSNAGGMQVLPVRKASDFEKPLPGETDTGGPLDGVDGTHTWPFVAAPDRAGIRLRFGIAWAGDEDFAGGVIARAHGLNAGRMPNPVDNTDIYRLMYATLFGKWLP